MIDSNTDVLVNQSEKKHNKSRNSFRMIDILDLGNQFIERATLVGNAVGNFKS